MGDVRDILKEGQTLGVGEICVADQGHIHLGYQYVCLIPKLVAYEGSDTNILSLLFPIMQ